MKAPPQPPQAEKAAPAPAGVGRWTVRFVHAGRRHTLFKRADDKAASFYIEFEHLKRRHKQSLATADKRLAIDRAKLFLDSVKAERWADVDKVKQRRSSATLADVVTVYLANPGIGRRSARNNVLAMQSILNRVAGQPRDPATVSLLEIDGGLAARFQDLTVERYVAGLTDDPAVREARGRALRSSRSTVCQARSLFSARPDNDVMARYKAAGLSIPPTVRQFAEARVRGSTVKPDYHIPPDAVIQQTFAEIETHKDDPDVYLAFWFAVGAGLRRSEIRHLRWEHLVNRDGVAWVSGGVGKDGQRIEVPVQARAMERIQPFRQVVGPVLRERGVSLRWAKRLNAWMESVGWRTEKKMHELRAYVGSLIYRQSPLAAMRFMRHKSIAVTERFYCRYVGGVAPVNVL